MGKRKRFNGNKYMFNNDHVDEVYRFEIVDGQIKNIYVKNGEKSEHLETDPENKADAMHCYHYGYPITEEQYQRYNPKYGLIACGLIENHTCDTHYNEKYYAEERAKGIKLGYIKEP